MMKLISGQVMDQERALYGLRDAKVASCRFEGPADGESALKECACLSIEDCDFLLRYPLWHVRDTSLADCRMTDTCRAALWYDEDGEDDDLPRGMKRCEMCRQPFTIANNRQMYCPTCAEIVSRQQAAIRQRKSRRLRREARHKS